MLLPLSKHEISEFLCKPPAEIELLWDSNQLRRTLRNGERDTSELAMSSVFDVIEYAMQSGRYGIKLTKEAAALWVLELAELCEYYDCAEIGPKKTMLILYEWSLSEQLPTLGKCKMCICNQIVAAYFELLNLCFRLEPST